MDIDEENLTELVVGQLVMINGAMFRLTSQASYHNKPPTATLTSVTCELET